MSTTKRNDKHNGPALPPEQALEILAAAVNLCVEAGLTVKAANTETGLLLTVDGARIATNRPITCFVVGMPRTPARDTRPMTTL